MFIEEKGEEVKNVNKEKQQAEINAIIERHNGGQLTKTDLKQIDKIKNRNILPGKKWFLEQKPGMYCFFL